MINREVIINYKDNMEERIVFRQGKDWQLAIVITMEPSGEYNLHYESTMQFAYGCNSNSGPQYPSGLVDTGIMRDGVRWWRDWRYCFQLPRDAVVKLAHKLLEMAGEQLKNDNDLLWPARE